MKAEQLACLTWHRSYFIGRWRGTVFTVVRGQHFDTDLIDSLIASLIDRVLTYDTRGQFQTQARF